MPVSLQGVVVERLVLVGEARFGVALDGNSETGDLSLTNAHLVNSGGRTSRESGVGVVVEQNRARIFSVHGVTTGRGSRDPYFRQVYPFISFPKDKAHVIPAGICAMGEGLCQIDRLKIQLIKRRDHRRQGDAYIRDVEHSTELSTRASLRVARCSVKAVIAKEDLVIRAGLEVRRALRCVAVGRCGSMTFGRQGSMTFGRHGSMTFGRHGRSGDEAKVEEKGNKER